MAHVRKTQTHVEQFELPRNRRVKLGKTRRVKRAVWRSRGKICDRLIKWLWLAIQHGDVDADAGNDVRATTETIFVNWRLM
jgi:hypothetical protein